MLRGFFGNLILPLLLECCAEIILIFSYSTLISYCLHILKEERVRWKGKNDMRQRKICLGKTRIYSTFMLVTRLYLILSEQLQHLREGHLCCTLWKSKQGNNIETIIGP